MRKRLLCMLLVAAMAVLMLAGCTSPTPPASSQPTASGSESPSPSPSEKSADPVTLRFSWWGSDARHEATLKAIEKYRETHPNVTIEGEYQGYDGYQKKLMTQLAGKTEPDLIQLDYVWYPDLSAQGDIFVDLSKDSNIDLTPYSSSVLNQYCSIDGKVIALPMGTNGFGAMINRPFFEKHKIPVDTEWTWEKVIEEGKRIHSENPNDYLFAIESGTSTGGVGPFVMSAYIYNSTGKYWADESTYKIQASKEDFVKAFTVIQELFKSGAAQPLGEASLFTGQMEQNPKWLNGEIGFTIDWSGTVGKYKSAVGAENFAVAKPPFAQGAAEQRIPMKPSMVLGVSSRSKNVAAATEFANWMMNDPEAAVILGTQRSVPTNSNSFEVLSKANALDADVAAMCEFTNASPAAPVPFVQSNTEVADIVKDICEQVAFGKLSPENASEQFISKVQAKLDALKK